MPSSKSPQHSASNVRKAIENIKADVIPMLQSGKRSWVRMHENILSVLANTVSQSSVCQGTRSVNWLTQCPSQVCARAHGPYIG